MNNLEIIETVDCTPTWCMLLPAILDVYATLQSKKRLTDSDYSKHSMLRNEFKRMAEAADKWNEHCKKS